MTRLVSKLMSLFKEDSEDAKKQVAAIKSDVENVVTAKVGCLASVSRIANHFPDYLSNNATQNWSLRAGKLLNEVKVESSVPGRSVDDVLYKLSDSYLDAQEMLRFTAKSEKEVRLLYVDMLRESCRQVLLINGSIEQRFISLLNLQDVMIRWDAYREEFKFKFVESVCNNVLVFNFLGQIKAVSDKVSSDKKSENILAIKKILLSKLINDIVKDTEFKNDQLSSIITERAFFESYVHSYLDTGMFNVKLGMRLRSSIENAEAKCLGLQELYGLFSRITLDDDQKLLQHVGIHYPEIAEEVAEQVLLQVSRGEKEFFWAINLLVLMNRYDLACQALDPSNTNVVTTQFITDKMVSRSYQEYKKKNENTHHHYVTAISKTQSSS